MNYLILGSGQGSRFVKTGMRIPKPFITQLDLKPFYRHVMDNYKLPSIESTDRSKGRTLLALRGEYLRRGRPNDVELIKTILTQGPAETVIQAIDVADQEGRPLVGPLVVLDCDCWLDLDLPKAVQQWTTEDYYLNADAIVFSVPYTTKYKHLTVPVPEDTSGYSDFRKKFAPKLQRIAIGNEGRVNPGLYFFHDVSFARQMLQLYMNTRPHAEGAIINALDYHWNRDRVRVAELDAPFTCVGTPEELQDALSERDGNV